MAMFKKIIVRQVWGNNLDEELGFIYNAIFHYRFKVLYFISISPKKTHICLPPLEYYSIMNKNVNALHFIQLSDANGNLPDFFSPFQYLRQFNFRDFYPKIHHNNTESISLLHRQGTDFDENKKNSIDSHVFALKFKTILLDLNRIVWSGKVTWITFQGSYDFAYLIKILIGGELPDDLEDIMKLMHIFFSARAGFYDLKQIMKIYGGLERVGTFLGLDRVVGSIRTKWQ